MKKLILLLFIPLISFGQNPPVVISSDFKKINDKEKELFLLSTYSNLKNEGVSFADSYFKIKNRSVVFVGNKANKNDNILITISRNDESLDEIFPKFLSSFKNAYDDDEKKKMGLSFEIYKSGYDIHKTSKLKYAFISTAQVWEKFMDSLNYQRYSKTYFIELSKEVKLELIINTKKDLNLDDVLIDVLPFKDFYKIGLEKFSDKDFTGAIKNFNKAIDFFGKTQSILFQRGNAKLSLKYYEAAIEDYNLSIEIKPDAGTYYNRAISKYWLNNKSGACEDAQIAEQFGFDASKMVVAACN